MPGVSSGLVTAMRLGLPAEIVEEAKQRLTTEATETATGFVFSAAGVPLVIEGTAADATAGLDKVEAVKGPGRSPSPFVDWSLFPDWAAFEASVEARIGNLLPDSGRRANKLARRLGPIRFELSDPRPEVFEQCVRWKSAQYRATGLPDLFAGVRRQPAVLVGAGLRPRAVGLLAGPALAAREPFALEAARSLRKRLGR